MGGASLPSMAVWIFRPWTISLVVAEVICATVYAALTSRLVAGWAFIAAPCGQTPTLRDCRAQRRDRSVHAVSSSQVQPVHAAPRAGWRGYRPGGARAP